MDEDIEKIIGSDKAVVLYVGTREWDWIVRKSKYYKNIGGTHKWKDLTIVRVIGYNYIAAQK